MRESDYYPAGAYNDPSAPFNEPVIPERDFDVEVTITMSKVVTVTTNNYQPEYDEEDGHTYANTENTEWDKAFADSGHFTIAELLEELKGYVVEDMKTCAPNTGKGLHLRRLLLACEDWDTTEETYDEL